MLSHILSCLSVESRPVVAFLYMILVYAFKHGFSRLSGGEVANVRGTKVNQHLSCDQNQKKGIVSSSRLNGGRCHKYT